MSNNGLRPQTSSYGHRPHCGRHDPHLSKTLSPSKGVSMKNARHKRPRRSSISVRGGFTIVELLIGMTLLAMILGAIALAMHGAAAMVAYSKDQSRSQIIATLALERLRTDLRRADQIQLISPAQVVGLVMLDGELKGYSWNGSVGGPLIYACGASPGGNTMVAAVEEFTLTSVEEYSDIQGQVVAVNVHIVLEVRYGQATTRLETTVRPRRNVM